LFDTFSDAGGSRFAVSRSASRRPDFRGDVADGGERKCDDLIAATLCDAASTSSALEFAADAFKLERDLAEWIPDGKRSGAAADELSDCDANVDWSSLSALSRSAG
jgi:hypothetical protein